MFVVDKIKAGERLEEILRDLEIKNPRQFALGLEIDPSSFNKAIKGKLVLSEGNLDSLFSKFKVNPAWYLYGKDEKTGIDTRDKYKVPSKTKVKSSGMSETAGGFQAELIKIRAALGVLEQMVDLSVSKQTKKTIGIVSAERRKAVSMEIERLLKQLHNNNN